MVLLRDTMVARHPLPYLKVPHSILSALRCPVCTAQLAAGPEGLACKGADCRRIFPIVNGIPIVIDESKSVFEIDDFLEGRGTYFHVESRLRRIAKRVLPDLGSNVRSGPNFARFVGLVRGASRAPRVLVIGGGILGIGMDVLVNATDIELVETDVSLGPRTQLVCDAHDIPFQDASFDGVVAQAVLEHVLDPHRCVDEIYRVLATGGYVYVETPFMQQVHGGKYDFTRFTYLGHRRLFRYFEQLDGGVVGGPALALAWAYRYFLLSLVSGARARAFMQGFARLTAFWLRFLDPLLLNNAGSFDGASGYYLLGRKSDRPLSDHELLELHRGA
jgi:SAM-dependent methyltransferase